MERMGSFWQRVLVCAEDGGHVVLPFLTASHLAVVAKTVLGSHFGGLLNSPPIVEPIFSGDWDVRWGYGLWILTHGHLARCRKGTPRTKQKLEQDCLHLQHAGL